MSENKQIENIIIIHLESFNEDIFLKEIDELPNLKWVKEHGQYWNNFFSTATSTIMSVSDVINGDSRVCEKSTSLADFVLDGNKGILEELEEIGIEQQCVCVYPKLDYEYDGINFRKIFGDKAILNNMADYNSFAEKIHNCVMQSDRFFLYVYDWTSLIYGGDSEPEELDRWCRRRYQHIDQTVGIVLEQLRNYDKLSNTMVVLFGDHGDDAFSRSLNNGFTHAIEPSFAVTKVPLLILSPGKQLGIQRNLADITDIKKVITNEIKSPAEKFHSDKKYSYARNLFQNQKSKILKKGYSVTNGNYLLLVTRKGMELYYIRYANYRNINLLNFFNISSNGELRDKRFLNYIPGYHFKKLIVGNCTEFKAVFEELRGVLKEHLQKMLEEGNIEDFSLKAFEKINYNTVLKQELAKCSIINILYDINNKYFKRKQ